MKTEENDGIFGRDSVLGDDELAEYCLAQTCEQALEKGTGECEALLDKCNAELEEGLVAKYGHNPQACVRGLISLIRGWWGWE